MLQPRIRQWIKTTRASSRNSIVATCLLFMGRQVQKKVLDAHLYGVTYEVLPDFSCVSEEFTCGLLSKASFMA